MNTFGFGYSLKSKMLLEMAEEGGGSFAFIPDAGVLGTCFVSCVANSCSLVALHSKVHLISKNGSKVSWIGF